MGPEHSTFILYISDTTIQGCKHKKIRKIMMESYFFWLTALIIKPHIHTVTAWDRCGDEEAAESASSVMELVDED